MHAWNISVLVATLLCTFGVASAHAQGTTAAGGQTFFKCTDAQGRTQYTDVGCGTMSSAPIAATDNANMDSRKAQNDARVQRDKQLAAELESQRLSAAADARAADSAQLGADRSVGSRLASERDARNNSTTSVLSPPTCLGCRSLGN